MKERGTFAKGFVKLPRDLYSELLRCPPTARELYIWLLVNANFRDRRVTGKLIRRGQVLTNYRQMQQELRWTVGCRPEQYSTSQIESALKALKVAGLVTTAKTTRGLIVTVCEYNTYQNSGGHENHDEDHTIPEEGARRTFSQEEKVAV